MAYIMDGFRRQIYEDTITGTDTKIKKPNQPTTEGTITPPQIHSGAMTGWVCPVCGRGLSPFTTFCPCKGYIKYDIECLY